MTERAEQITGRGNGGSILVHIGTNNADKEGTTAIVETQPASPVGPHVGFRGDTWAKLGLGFRWAVYLVWSGPHLGPS